MATALASLFPRQSLLARPPLASCRALCKPQPSRASALRTPFSRFYSSTAAKDTVQHSTSISLKLAGVATIGLGLSTLVNWTPIFCEPGPRSTTPTPPPPPKGAQKDGGLPPLPPQAESSLNLYELSFGTVCGICAGVFVKKGAKALAFTLGGVFVLLQYLGSISVVKVDWARMGSRFEKLFYSTGENGAKKPPTVYSLWRWLVDFLTADFQPRASFLAGLALGLRIG